MSGIFGPDYTDNDESWDSGGLGEESAPFVVPGPCPPGTIGIPPACFPMDGGATPAPQQQGCGPGMWQMPDGSCIPAPTGTQRVPIPGQPMPRTPPITSMPPGVPPPVQQPPPPSAQQASTTNGGSKWVLPVLIGGVAIVAVVALAGRKAKPNRRRRRRR